MCHSVNEEDKNIKIIGTSAGALSACMLACGCDFRAAAAFAIAQSEEAELFSNPTGLAFKWGPIIREWLEEMLPPSLDNRPDGKGLSTCDRQRLDCLVITATPMRSLLPFSTVPKQFFLQNFSSKTDVIDACMASVHIPLFLDRKLYTKYENNELGRSRRLIDGSFWNFVTKGKYKCQLPDNLVVDKDKDSAQEIEIGDWTKDKVFASRMGDTTFVSLVTPEGLYVNI